MSRPCRTRLPASATASIFVAIITCAGPFTARASAAGEEEPSARATAREVLTRLDRKLRGITALRGKFVQTFTSAGLGVPQAERGRFALKRPDLLRWDYSDPERKTAVSDGVNTWLHVPEDNVVYRGTVAAWRDGSALALLAGGGFAEAWDAEGLDATTAERRGNVVLRLKPRRAGEDLEEMLVELEPKSLSIAAVTAVDGMGNRISSTFTDVEENPALPAELFRFSPPPGARVVDQDAPRGAP